MYIEDSNMLGSGVWVVVGCWGQDHESASLYPSTFGTPPRDMSCPNEGIVKVDARIPCNMGKVGFLFVCGDGQKVFSELEM